MKRGVGGVRIHRNGCPRFEGGRCVDVDWRVEGYLDIQDC